MNNAAMNIYVCIFVRRTVFNCSGYVSGKDEILPYAAVLRNLKDITWSERSQTWEPDIIDIIMGSVQTNSQEKR